MVFEKDPWHGQKYLCRFLIRGYRAWKMEYSHVERLCIIGVAKDGM